MIGEDDGSVALGNASHRHMENAMRSLDVMLLQAEDRSELSDT